LEVGNALQRQSVTGGGDTFPRSWEGSRSTWGANKKKRMIAGGKRASSRVGVSRNNEDWAILSLMMRRPRGVGNDVAHHGGLTTTLLVLEGGGGKHVLISIEGTVKGGLEGTNVGVVKRKKNLQKLRGERGKFSGHARLRETKAYEFAFEKKERGEKCPRGKRSTFFWVKPFGVPTA